MTHSSLATRTLATTKYSDRNGLTPRRLIVHHCGSTSNGNDTYLATGDNDKSATYCLRNDNVLVAIVPEEHRPWTTGGHAYDGDAITIEVVNSTAEPEWAVTDAQLETIARLAAELSTRYGWGPLTRTNVVGHREVNASTGTSCPGPYLLPRLDDIVRRANELLDSSPAKPAAPAPQKDKLMTTYIDGQPVRDDVAAAFRLLAAAFFEAFGLTLHVRDGLRSMENQRKAWDIYQRYGQPVAAYPDPKAPHIEGRALDLYDSGTDAGVTVVGSQRNRWLQDNCGRFGFTHTGVTFRPPEGWHIEKTHGAQGGGGGSRGGYQNGSPELRAFQEKLIRMGHDLGPTGADAKNGPRTTAATLHEQRSAPKNGYPHALDDDGIPGDKTNAYLDWWLAKVSAPQAPAFPLPGGWYFGPASGPTESVSGFHGNGEHLQRWQQRMADRGWNITPDGRYGDQTRDVAIAFQREKGLGVDGKIGPETWAAAWTAPVS